MTIRSGTQRARGPACTRAAHSHACLIIPSPSTRPPGVRAGPTDDRCRPGIDPTSGKLAVVTCACEWPIPQRLKGVYWRTGGRPEGAWPVSLCIFRSARTVALNLMVCCLRSWHVVGIALINETRALPTRRIRCQIPACGVNLIKSTFSPLNNQPGQGRVSQEDTMSTEKEPLRGALRAAAQRSHSPALEVSGVVEAQRSPDWLRILSGRALATADVEGGMAIPRRLTTAAGDVELVEHAFLASAAPGATLFLRAEAGEGKTTYFSLLDNALKASAIVSTWVPGQALNLEDVQNLTDITRSLLDTEQNARDREPLPVVVLAELRPSPDITTVDMILSTLNAHEGRGDEAIFIIAGRSSAINSLVPRPIGVEYCSLGSIATSETAMICERLKRAHDEISRAMSPTRINDLFPNLAAFLQLSPTEQASYFLVPQQPLIVGFLRAVYGRNFIQRLVDEYSLLENVADRQAYLHVCLATMSGIALPERILRSLAQQAALDARSRYDPWVRTDDDDHVARHPVIAQTVIESSGDYTALSECFEGWTDLVRRQPQDLSLLFDVANGIANMRPLSVTNKRIPARIRSRLADALIMDGTLVNRLLAEKGTSAALLFSWGKLVRSILPAKPTDRYVTLYETAADLLGQAYDLARQTDRALAERVEYEWDCTIRDCALAANETEPIEEREDRIIRWRDFLDRAWATPKFYFELFNAARDIALELTYQGVPDRDSDSLYWAYVTCGQAYQYLYASQNKFYINQVMQSYGDILNRAMYYALPTRNPEVWREIWRAALRLSHSFASAGITYAESLIKRASESDLDTAIAALRENLNVFNHDPGSLYLLAKIASARAGGGGLR